MELIPESSHYEIQEFIGEGLTGKVYKALRWDSQRKTNHRVAIKFTNSKNHVSILRHEFNSLKNLNSKNCVRLLAWENFPRGPALILEYIDGLTLKEGLKYNGPLSPELAQEILCQIYQGLLDLNHCGSFHGDLAPSNIMINSQGRIQLIDFGSLDPSQEQNLAHQAFASPEILKGSRPNLASDLYSLGKIYQLISHSSTQSCSHNSLQFLNLMNSDPQLRQFPTNLSSSQNGQLQLQDFLRIARKGKIELQRTQLISKSSKNRKPVFSVLKTTVFIFGILLSSMVPKVLSDDIKYGELQVRDNQWLQFSFNGLSPKFAPQTLAYLRHGLYSISWKTQSSKGKSEVEIKINRQTLFSPSQNLSEKKSQWVNQF